MKHPKKLQRWMKRLLLRLKITDYEDLVNWYYIKNTADRLTIYCWYEPKKVMEINLREVG